MQNKAVVVGALGVIGRYIVERLVEEPNWQVVGLSRRKATDGPRYCHIAVDLLDPEDTKRKLAELTGVTHVFYAAFQPTPGNAANFASNTGPNRDILVKLGDRDKRRRASSKTSRACHWYQILRRAPWAAEDADA
jgi:nucleoside-diphosphate-sugar epimerase